MPMQVSWIDADEMSTLLGRLREPAPVAEPEPSWDTAPTSLLAEEEAVIAITESAPEPERVTTLHASDHPDLQDFRQRLQAIRARAMDAGLLPAVEDDSAVFEAEEPLPPDEAPSEMASPELHEPETMTAQAAHASFQPSGQTVMERLASFVAWSGTLTDQASLYVIADQGDVLWEGGGHPGLVQTTVMAWVATSRMSAVFAFERAPVLRREMGGGLHLLALPCPTRLGLMHVAVMSRTPLPDERVPELRAALIAAMESSS